MLNFRKICRVLLLASLAVIIDIANSWAASGVNCKAPYTVWVSARNECCNPNSGSKTVIGAYSDCVPMIKETKNEDGTVTKTVDKNVAETYDNTVRTDNTTPTKVTNTNSKASSGAGTGCSKDLGLFSGLINTGNKIFKGLRDLIYVVAGFGIIGVAVGGFFGNLNWKWLGAIIIALVVIATTGELINAITGCTEFTSSMITDTLK